MLSLSIGVGVAARLPDCASVFMVGLGSMFSFEYDINATYTEKAIL
jgi:hypothetical protein